MGDETLPTSRDRNPDGKPPGTLADPVMLDKIDRLFACNVGDYIDLPQVVVVGDQSSGKSSVLEGLTNLPFPRDSGLCTRFVTKITFRRSQLARIFITIIPAKNSSTEHAEHVRGWAKADLRNLDEKTFADIMKEVHTVMGLSEQVDGVTPPTFSDDVLSLEVCGPEQEHLSIIDVPGIFKKTTQGVTSKADIQMVRSMVLAYMKNPRSVMLTVIPANVDIATQEILEMAEEVDPDGQRTLGVLTKPDLVDKGAEKTIVDLIEGRRHRLALGWLLVRNPGQQELTDVKTDRYALEKSFFSHEQPWKSLDKEKVGISALQVRVREILAEHIRHDFPKVTSELNKELKRCKNLLSDLGPKRDTPAEQFKHLIDIATRFQENVGLALTARYWGNDIFDKYPSLRLATAVVHRNNVFANTVEECGHTFCFSSQNATDSEAKSETNDSESDKERFFHTRVSKSNGDIEDLIHENEELPVPAGDDILGWLTTVYDDSRGFEIGTFDSSLLAPAWKEQSQKWDGIALGYISDVIAITHTFVTNMLHHTCPDERIRTGLSSLLMDGLMERYKKALTQVEFVLQVERSGNPMTLNHYFNDNLEKCRQKRMRKTMLTKSFDNCKHGTVVPLDAIMENHPMSNMQHIVQDLHDILQSYYKVARKRFVDTICMQAVDHHLISGQGTPIKLFSPAFVAAMSPEQLDEVAGEDPRQRRKRKQLQKEVQDLEAGKKILI
ncbi:Interferon-induced GTP-binding protein Mx2 [Lachnellula cervina]|uniref:Interferon-induced GTP-binding protein Mx2 n=1 Tax=Lachnellula cervina TaxID=1316786 RepID=A0A7D8YTZ3_9HELO|nr:Interferon-induced GTP-binding protein Mx2 [Lachnellula cervina]